jgi:hypothetical protein
MRIIATTPNGPLTITAGQGTRRRYSGEGWSKSISLIARTQRWYGSLGLYDPADSFSPYGRLLAEEGQLHFSTVARAMGWIHERNLEAVSADDRPIYTGDGLVLCYSNRPVPGSGVATRSVQIWQFYVGGSRPHDLPGASDGAIHVEGGAIAATSTTVAAPAQ